MRFGEYSGQQPRDDLVEGMPMIEVPDTQSENLAVRE
jgi:hypothetical protein